MSMSTALGFGLFIGGLFLVMVSLLIGEVVGTRDNPGGSP